MEPGATGAHGHMTSNLGLKLTNLVLAVLLLSCAIAAVIALGQKSYLSGFLFLLAAGFLLSSWRWSDYGRLSLVFFLLFFYNLKSILVLITQKQIKIAINT